MFVTHGYLPPVKSDKYVHTTITLELCLETMAQLIKMISTLQLTAHLIS